VDTRGTNSIPVLDPSLSNSRGIFVDQRLEMNSGPNSQMPALRNVLIGSPLVLVASYLRCSLRSRLMILSHRVTATPNDHINRSLLYRKVLCRSSQLKAQCTERYKTARGAKWSSSDMFRLFSSYPFCTTL